MTLGLGLAACGGGGSDSSSDSGNPSPGGGSATPTPGSTVQGRFIDAAVTGLDYYIDGVKAGTTTSEGVFDYPAGKSVTFKVGAVTLGTASGGDLSVVTPASLAASAGAMSNILVLLQSLDADANPDNGIFIPFDRAQALKTAVDLSASGSSLASVRTDLPSLNLVSEASALAHFNASLVGVVQPTPSPGMSAFTDALVGYWLGGCQAGFREVSKVVKLAANKLRVESNLSRKYANANCTGSYADKTTGGKNQMDDFTVVSAYAQPDGSVQASISVFTTETGTASDTLQFVMAADHNSVQVTAPAETDTRVRVDSLAIP